MREGEVWRWVMQEIMKKSNNINEQIIAMDNSERVFEFLINMLDYKNTSNFSAEKNADYDALFTIKIEQRDYTVVGIKVYNEKDEQLILKNHLKYWNENEVPFSILILPDEIKDFKYDKILVAIENEKVAEEIICELVNMGYDELKIVWKSPLKEE